MTTVLALIGALALAVIPVRLGWRRGWQESQMARAFGLEGRKRRFDPEAWAAQTGTGLTFRQIAFGAAMWTAGGLVVGLLLGGPIQMILFAVSGGLFYLGTLGSRRDDFRMAQAKDILHALGILKGLLREGVGFEQALEQAVHSAGRAGREVLEDLYHRLKTASPEQYAEAVAEWSQRWQNPAVDLLAGVLIAAFRGRIEMVKVLDESQAVIREQVRILSHGRAEAKGIEWQAKFLALWPPFVMLFIRFTSGMGNTWANPVYILPLFLGAGLSYYLTMRMVRSRLSLEASLGLLPAGQGEIPTDRFGKPL